MKIENPKLIDFCKTHNLTAEVHDRGTVTWHDKKTRYYCSFKEYVWIKKPGSESTLFSNGSTPEAAEHGLLKRIHNQTLVVRLSTGDKKHEIKIGD